MLYYELLNGCRKTPFRVALVPGYYYSEAAITSDIVAHESTRVWEENKDGVRYFKNRLGPAPVKVDMKEFMFIKLKARRI